MTLRTNTPSALAAVLLACAGCTAAAPSSPPPGGEGSATRLPIEEIDLPAGFSISVVTDEVPGARSLALSPSGVLFVGTRTGDAVRAVLDTDGDGRADEIVAIAAGLRVPNGVALKDGDLYIAEISRILRIDDVDAAVERVRQGGARPRPDVVYDGYPTNRHHGWKYVAFGPEGALHVPVGAPCNVCEEPPPHASITRLVETPDGTWSHEVVASGVRNTVGFDWHPETGELWFTDNGRDMLGDDIPPDELNRAPRAGLDFGFPRCHGVDVLDPVYGEDGDCERSVPPARELGPHVAALGMVFYDGDSFPSEYRGDVFIAEHGSWNRSTKIGYRVTRVPVEGNEATGYEVFASGWLRSDGTAWGRPVDVIVDRDGSLLVSDDHAGAIYRIRHDASKATRK